MDAAGLLKKQENNTICNFDQARPIRKAPFSNNNEMKGILPQPRDFQAGVAEDRETHSSIENYGPSNTGAFSSTSGAYKSHMTNAQFKII